MFVLFLTVLASGAVSFILTYALLPVVSKRFISRGLCGQDIGKHDKPVLPESLGALGGMVFIAVSIQALPVAFPLFVEALNPTDRLHEIIYSLDILAEYLSGLLSILSMIFLGFADDVLDIPGRFKMLFPGIASLPLLMVYHLKSGLTTVVLPIALRPFLGKLLDVGVLYYAYMLLLCVFLSNAINILAGINGLEAGQCVVIAISVLITNAVGLWCSQGIDSTLVHSLSVTILVPFIGVTLAILKFNWYPAKMFVGDSFCYFAGMVFAVVGILGRFSKTLCLFFIPQFANALYSGPQVFRILPCPRHRIPRLVKRTGKLTYSKVDFKDLGRLGWVVVRLGKLLRVIKLETSGEGPDLKYTMNNCTLLNLILLWFGDMHEEQLTCVLLLLQVMCSLLAFTIRFSLVRYLYEPPYH